MLLIEFYAAVMSTWAMASTPSKVQHAAPWLPTRHPFSLYGLKSTPDFRRTGRRLGRCTVHRTPISHRKEEYAKCRDVSLVAFFLIPNSRDYHTFSIEPVALAIWEGDEASRFSRLNQPCVTIQQDSLVRDFIHRPHTAVEDAHRRHTSEDTFGFRYMPG